MSCCCQDSGSRSAAGTRGPRRGGLDGGGEPRGLRAVSDVPAEQHPADDLAGADYSSVPVRRHAGQLSILRQVAAEHPAGQAEHLVREQVGDLEQHPAS